MADAYRPRLPARTAGAVVGSPARRRRAGATCHDARVATTRSVLAGGCVVLVMLTTAACVQVNEAINSRELECDGVPDDICVRLADLADPPSRAKFSTIVRIVVRPTDCGDIEDSGMVRRPGMVRCWGVEAWAASGAGVGLGYYENADGRIFDDGNEVVAN